MRELLIAPNDTLRTPCEPVGDIDSEVKLLIQELTDLMLARREDEVIPIGLAAPQLGALLRVFVFYPNPSYRDRRGVDVLINPELLKVGTFTKVRETCLSLPGKAYILSRAKRVKVRGLNLYGKTRSYKATGLVAQIFQHELDHLQGVLIDKGGALVEK